MELRRRSSGAGGARSEEGEGQVEGLIFEDFFSGFDGNIYGLPWVYYGFTMILYGLLWFNDV